MQSALITGASGFLGRRLADRLGEEGVGVRGVDISTDLKRDVIAGDVSEPGPWQRAAEGCDVVVHTAAIVSNAASRELSWRVNVLGTRNAIDAAVAAGAKRFVHLSSVRVFGDLDFPDGVDEKHPVRADGSAYVDTKVAAEQVVLQAHAHGEIECVVLRPADVYGPGSRPWTILPLELIRTNRFVLPARGRGIFSPIYVDDGIDGTLLAARVPEAAGQVLTISGGAGVSCREFFGHYYRMLGKAGPPTLPTVAAVGVAAVPEVAARIGGTSTEYNRTSMRYFARRGTYSIEKARRVLGFEPKIDLAEGMGRTETWLREQGMLH